MKNKINIKKFTLIELIIVIVVIGVLAGMALPKFIGTTKDAKVAAMDQDLDVLEKAVMLYESDNDGAEPFLKDGGGNYAKVSITRQTLKDTLDAIGDDESSVYTLNMDSLKPYLERLKFTDPMTDTYLYSTKTGVAINEQGKIDSSGITHHILNGIGGINNNQTQKIKLKSLMVNSSVPSSFFGISDTNTLYAWGDNQYGELGNGTSDTNMNSMPIKITLPNNVNPIQIVNGYYYSMAIGSDGELYTWGNNSSGQLGDETTDEKHTPTKIELASGVKPTQIAASNCQSMAIGSDGELYTWGSNGSGQLGIGTKDYDAHSTPTKISLPNGIKPTQITCGNNFSMVLGNDGNLYSCGFNVYGELGDGTNGDKLTLTKITMSNGIKFTQISSGRYHTLAIGSDGELYSWGYNIFGELGNGFGVFDYFHSYSPNKITLAEGIKPTKVVACAEQSYAIGTDGELYFWGYDHSGSYGDGITDKSIPKKTILAEGVKPTQIAYGMVLGSDRELYTISYTRDRTNPIEWYKMNFDFE